MNESMERLVEAVVGKLFIPLEASGRHVHVTKEQAMTLFGHGLTPVRPLSQPGQYLAKERVTVKGPKGEFHNVAVPSVAPGCWWLTSRAPVSWNGAVTNWSN